MIGWLSGVLRMKNPSDIIVDTGGVGYLVHVPVRTLAELPAEGDTVELFIYTHVREDAIQLFGFKTPAEKRVFITLLSISGVGPKVALSVLSGLSYDDFLLAVETEDVSVLTRIPGLGKKTAHRIVLELRGKLPRDGKPVDSLYNDTLSALINLGYKRQHASDALDAARKSGASDIETLLRESLKLLTSDK